MNKHKPTRKTLTLHRESLRNLTTAALVAVHGGMINESRLSQCDCPTVFCTIEVPNSRVNTACTQP